MTPDEARDLLDGTTPGPWFFDDDMAGRIYTIGPIVPSGTELGCTTDDAALATYAPDMAAMIAGMRTEYRAEYQSSGGRWFPVPRYCSCGRGWDTKQQAERAAEYWKADGYATRIIRHYVTKPEEV